jgi:predicted alpha-1,2-mannosidase
MIRGKIIAVAILMAGLLVVACSGNNIREMPDKDFLTSAVNPFMGVEQGNTVPGSSLPFSLVRLSPDITEPQPTNGYRSDRRIVGFSHTHSHGTGGGPRYGNIMIIPQVGPVKVKNNAAVKKVNEFARPGYYAVTLARKPGDVHCELTSTPRAGFHKYRFYTWDNRKTLNANVLIDVSHTNTRGGPKNSRCTGGNVKVESDTSISGFGAFKGGWGQDNPYKIYFYAIFNRPFDSTGTWNGVNITGKKETSGTDFGAFARFKVRQNDQIQVKVGISLLSEKMAKVNLVKEIPRWEFWNIRQQADSIWKDKLNRIQVEGGSPEQKVKFYSCLRNALMMPTDVTGENPNWESDTAHYWDFYTIWDIFRTAMPLNSLILPDRQREMIRCMLDIYDHKGWLPDAWVAGDYSNIQGGTNADVVIADAFAKKLGGFDKEKAYQAIKKNTEVVSENPQIKGRYLKDYQKYGYVTSETTTGAISKTLEYAYNDYCIAQVAEDLGYQKDYKKYLKRSRGIFNLFYREKGHFWAKDTSGNWKPNFSRTPIADQSWNDPYFYEGGTQIYTAYVPHDMRGLIEHMGGEKAFGNYLNRLIDSTDFEISNEPTFLIPYAYNYIGKPARTAEEVRKILSSQYLPGRNGLPGQDDAGAISSWYVFSAMGFFPVAGQDLYLIGSPVFEKTSIQLENGNTFTIHANNTSTSNKYVQSAKLNGKPLRKNWFRHTEIKNGGKLELKMGSQPSEWGEKNLPPSISQ